MATHRYGTQAAQQATMVLQFGSASEKLNDFAAEGAFSRH
jgi:hypothetical protein